jgi:hypothetical protein
MIKQKMASGEIRADDHYNLGLALSAVFYLSKALETLPDDGVLINELARAQIRLKKIQ